MVRLSISLYVVLLTIVAVSGFVYPIIPSARKDFSTRNMAADEGNSFFGFAGKLYNELVPWGNPDKVI